MRHSVGVSSIQCRMSVLPSRICENSIPALTRILAYPPRLPLARQSAPVFSCASCRLFLYSFLKSSESGAQRMPKFEVRSSTDVPPPSRSSRAIRELQAQYEAFLRGINGDAGELQLESSESMRSVKVRLRRAATRLGLDIDIWDANGFVYFKRATRRPRGRPAKNA